MERKTTLYILILLTSFKLATPFPAVAQAYLTTPALSPQPFEGQWAGWVDEDVTGNRQWEATKYWIVNITKINDTLYRGNFYEYHFERQGRENSGKIVHMISKKNIDLLPVKINPSFDYPVHDHIIYFNAVHTPYRSPLDSIQGYFVGQQVFVNGINSLSFYFLDLSKQHSNDIDIGMIDTTTPGMHFPFLKDEIPPEIKELKWEMIRAKPNMFSKHYYADLISIDNELALSGTYPIGSKVTLFNHLTGEIFITHVKNTKSKPADFWGDIKYSQLAEIPNWGNEKLHLYTTVGMGEVDSQISFLETTLYSDYDFRDSIHLGLSKAGILQKSEIWKKVSREPITDQMSHAEKLWKNLRTKSPMIYKIGGFGKELLFITYSVTDDGGPSFIKIGENLFTIPGECSSVPYFYLSNGILYLRLLSGDCGNGIVLVGNYAVFSDQLVEDYKSFDYSN
jgi:hypothetical protein